MIRKLMEVSLSLVLCFALAVPLLAQGIYLSPADYEEATGNKIESFSQAPMLKTMAASREILPLEMRLPEEPLVVEPVEEIGQYGGVLHLARPAEDSEWFLSSFWLTEPPIQLTPDLKGMYPNWLKGFKYSDDYKTWTLHLKEGLRWSDGAPLTADDVMFWYEDIIKNEELYPTKSAAMMRGGELAEVKKVDEYTVKFHFATSFPDFASGYLTLPEYMYNTGQIIEPKHYLMKYHIKYNPGADELAKKEGFDHWYQLFNNKGGGPASGFTTIGRPTLEPWVLKAWGLNHATFERNPYYWKVDTAGNQLPYLDRIEVKLLASREAFKMSIMGGETDFMATDEITAEDIPLLKKNEEKGNYEVRFWHTVHAAAGVYFFYQDYAPDPVLRDILRDVRFRRAMSLAIKREEMNKLIFFGKGTPSQGTVPPGSKYHVPETWQAYAQYNPEEANRLLDEMGLEWNKEHTFRLKPDGKPLFIKIWASELAFLKDMTELIKGYWEAVGVKTDYEVSARVQELMFAKKAAVTVECWQMLPDFIYQGWLWPPVSTEWWAPMAWYDAWIEGGRAEAEKKGVPEDVIRFYELTEQFGSVVSEEEKIKIAKRINLLWSENLWGIGNVGGDLPSPCVVKPYVRNVPQTGNVSYFSFFQIPYIPAQFFISK